MASREEEPPLCPFDASRHRWSLRLHILSGITLPAFAALLRRFRAHLSLAYAHRLIFLFCMACFNSACALLDVALYGRLEAAQPLHPRPLIVVGHPRSGTTHLHNLLAAEPGRWAVVDTFHAAFPSSFLVLNPLRRLLAPMLPPTRPMDAMALSWALPAEDEIATCALSGGLSPYMLLCFPAANVWPLLTLAPADGARPADVAAWEASFLRVCRRATLAAGGCKPLLLKSPVHAARLGALRRLFPGARFVGVHRHPDRVFASASHMACAYYGHTLLQPASAGVVSAFILRQGQALFEAYERGRAAAMMVAPGTLTEVAFAELDRDPAGAVGRALAELGLGWAGGEAAVRRYAASLRAFRQNELPLPDPAAKAAVRARWAAAFAGRFGYT